MRKQNTLLTPIEQRVLALVARGLTNEEISEQLFFSVNTVKMHLHHICIKLSTRSRTQAFLTAVKQNYLDLHMVFSESELLDLLSIWSEVVKPIVVKFRRSPRPAENITIAESPLNASTKETPKQTDGRCRQHRNHILSQELRVSRKSQDPGGNQKTLLLKNEERTALALAARGLTNKEIAEQLSVSTNRIKNILYKACIKLGARNRIEAIFYAVINEVIDVREIYDDNELAMLNSSIDLSELETAYRLRQKKFSPSFDANRQCLFFKEAAG